MTRTNRYLTLSTDVGNGDIMYICGRIRGIIAVATNELEHKSYPHKYLDADGNLWTKTNASKPAYILIKFLATDEELELVKKHLFINKLYSKIIKILEDINN